MKETTNEIVEALAKREGVERITVEPYEDKTVVVKGPAVILVITD